MRRYDFRHSRQALNLVGQRYGKLTVIEFSEHIDGRRAWLCKCDCGRIKIIRHDHLRRQVGAAQSCGCLKIEQNRINGKKQAVHLVAARKSEDNKNQQKWSRHHDKLLTINRQTKKTLILYSSQQPIEIILENVKYIEEVHRPLGTHCYSTISLINPSGKGLIKYGVIETKKQIMSL